MKIKFKNYPKPFEGQKIRLTWLPTPLNLDYRYHSIEDKKNCYIGSEGIVTDLDKNGSFVLDMNGAKLVVIDDQYKFEVI